MAEKPVAPNSLHLRGQSESEENLPNVPQFDSLTPDERQTLQLSVGHVVTLASNPQLPQVTQVVGRAARAAMQAPEDIVEQSVNRLSGTEMGQRLSQLSIEYMRTRALVATADSFLARARSAGGIRYPDLESELEKIFHESYDLTSLVHVHHFVAHLLLRILQDLGPESDTELCARIIRYFLAYLVRDNLLNFVARLFRETGRELQAGGAPDAGRDRVDSSRPVSTLAIPFAAGLTIGSVLSAVAILMLFNVARKR